MANNPIFLDSTAQSVVTKLQLIADSLDGKAIVSIAKTSTSGLVDTYTITYTDETTSTFTVTNGADGDDGDDGNGISSIAKTSTSGLVDTYTITFTDSTTTTFTVTNGEGVPTYTSSDANKALRVNSAGTSLVWGNAGGDIVLKANADGSCYLEYEE